MKPIKDRRKNERREVNYPVIIKIKNEYGYRDLGLRGLIKNLSIKGALIGELRSINLNGMSIEELLNISQDLWLMVYPPDVMWEVMTKRIWLKLENEKLAGVSFKSISERSVKQCFQT